MREVAVPFAVCTGLHRGAPGEHPWGAGGEGALDGEEPMLVVVVDVCCCCCWWFSLQLIIKSSSLLLKPELEWEMHRYGGEK